MRSRIPDQLSRRTFTRSTRSTRSRILSRWSGIVLALVALLAGALACSYDGGPIPSTEPTVTPCPATCPPPVRGGGSAHELTLNHFTLIYFDPWSTVNSVNSGDSSVTLGAQTQFGEVTASFGSQSVRSGTTGAQLLQTAIQQNLNTDQFSGLQDAGAINGAEIGYIAGAGESFQAVTSQPNAPNIPVYIEVMAATRGTTGLVFIAVSPLDPNSTDTSGVPNAEFDHLVNSVQWT